MSLADLEGLDMAKQMSDTDLLMQRLSRPQRIGVMGHRGVGKTTLLTALYQQAVSGRWPDLRLAAADARTAQYLADKIAILEAGQALPATLAETDLRFHLYHECKSIDLLFKDYQGEHVELGRDEPIRAFLKDCDAVWLCLDAGSLDNSAELLKRQQELEQIIEDYLACEPFPDLHRPMALLLTKADLLDSKAPDGFDEEWLAKTSIARHALEVHCHNRTSLAVSSLANSEHSSNLDKLLRWVGDALKAQDEARLEKLWSIAPGEIKHLQRAGATLARRYPRSSAVTAYPSRIKSLIRRQRRRRFLTIAASAAGLVGGLWMYDTVAHARTIQFEKDHAEAPAEVLQAWNSYRAWHPTRNVLSAAGSRDEEERLKELTTKARQHELTAKLSEWRGLALKTDNDPQDVWQRLQSIKYDFPDAEIGDEISQLQQQVQARRQSQLDRRADRAFEDLIAAEGNKTDLPALRDRADRFLKDFAGTPHEAEVRKRREAIRSRLEDNELQVARAYSAEHPLNFQTRKDHYHDYLSNHPNGALHGEAEAALSTIDREWDKH
ncbi:MAG TPA: hypothetical protein VGZ25_07335, partial [Gemmataceae bacterium]|nr:hypothetical protein [Gemmataceae bacterium]